MTQHLYEHPSGVFLHVDFTPQPVPQHPVINDVRLAGTNYEPIGPNLVQFLHNSHLIDTTGPVTMATPMLELVAQELPK